MSFNQKTIFTSIFICFIIFAGSFWYYKKTHPRYILPPLKPEITITIIPGWNLRQVADYLVKQGIASSTDDIYKLTGKPAVDYRKVGVSLPVINESSLVSYKPGYISYEGFLAPETYRVFKDAALLDVIKKLINQRDKEMDAAMWEDVKNSGHSFYEILTMASLLEEEVQNPDDKAKVADILWRRYKNNWALQLDSSVHYAVNKTGNVFTTDKEREFNSLWNTYKYSGLPLGPIANPGLGSIKAALHPEKNSYWYFLTGKDGTVYYGKTLEEHNANKIRL
ncbi:MAG: endolytic transglycosylase MltG [Patescibacteria group bacterium]